MKNILIKPKIPRHLYIYYDPLTMRLKAVSGSFLKDFSDVPHFKVPYTEGVGFITGEKNPALFMVGQDEKTSKPTLFASSHILEQTRSIDSGFIHIGRRQDRKAYKEVDLMISYRLGDNHLSVNLTEAGIAHADFVNGISTLEFYITPYNDPSFFVKKFSVQIKDLFKWRGIGIELGYTITRPMSVFTRKIFSSYGLKESRRK